MRTVKKSQKSTSENRQNFLKDWEKLNRKPVNVKKPSGVKR